MKRCRIFLSFMLAVSLLLISMPAHASVGRDSAYVARGAGRLIGSVFAIPKAMIQDSGRVMFPFGLVTGAIRGTVNMVSGVVGGATDVAEGSAPYAKYAALAI